MVVLTSGPSVLSLPPPPHRISGSRPLHFTLTVFRPSHFNSNAKLKFSYRIKSFQDDAAESSKAAEPKVTPEDQSRDDVAFRSLQRKSGGTGNGSSFLSKLGIILGIAAVITLVSVTIKQPNQGPLLGIQNLMDGSYSSTSAAPSAAFSFQAFGYRVVLPQNAPGWVYFWLLMAAGCGLFISEEALNIWVCPFCWLVSPWHGCFLWTGPGIL